MCKETQDVLDWTIIIYSNDDNIHKQSILSDDIISQSISYTIITIICFTSLQCPINYFYSKHIYPPSTTAVARFYGFLCWSQGGHYQRDDSNRLLQLIEQTIHCMHLHLYIKPHTPSKILQKTMYWNYAVLRKISTRACHKSWINGINNENWSRWYVGSSCTPSI